MPGRVEEIDTIMFIHKQEVPHESQWDVAYDRIICNIWPEKDNLNNARLTYGGSNYKYPDDCGISTADLLTVKLLLNSAISTLGANFMNIDIKNFYLMTSLDCHKYMKMEMENFLEDGIQQ